MDAKTHIGDGKLPNHYWVFQYEQKYQRGQDNTIELIETDTNTEGDLVGEFKTYEAALKATNEAYLPNVFIEDRLTGVVFEQLCVLCGECGQEEWETIEDIRHTKEAMEKRGVVFA